MIVALSIAEPVAAWLEAEPRCLRVHSAFPRAINLTGGDGQVLTLLAQVADDGPFGLRLPAACLPNLPAGIPARVEHGVLAAGPLVVDWQSAHRWDPTLRPVAQSPDTLALAFECLADCSSIFVAVPGLSKGWQNEGSGRRVGPPPRPGTGQRGRPSVFHTRLTIQATGHLTTLLAGLQGDDTALAEAVRPLVGFGAGLTPAGDDLLLGLLAARRMLGKPTVALEMAIRDSATRTTFLSAAFLRAACDGHFADHWHRLRDALEGGHSSETEGAMRHILAHGATSGADALVGWIVGAACSASPLKTKSQRFAFHQNQGR